MKPRGLFATSTLHNGLKRYFYLERPDNDESETLFITLTQEVTNVMKFVSPNDKSSLSDPHLTATPWSTRLTHGVTPAGKATFREIVFANLAAASPEQAALAIANYLSQESQAEKTRKTLVEFFGMIITGETNDSASYLEQFVKKHPINTRAVKGSKPAPAAYSSRTWGGSRIDDAEKKLKDERSELIANFMAAMIECNAVASLELFLPKFKQYCYEAEVRDFYNEVIPLLINACKKEIFDVCFRCSGLSPDTLFDNQTPLQLIIQALTHEASRFDALLKIKINDLPNADQPFNAITIKSAILKSWNEYVTDCIMMINSLLQKHRANPETARESARTHIQSLSSNHYCPEITNSLTTALSAIANAPQHTLLDTAAVQYDNLKKWLMRY